MEGTLLVVDDERAVVDAMREALEPFPYRVLATTDPHHALDLLKSDPSIDLLIADLYMPAMDGVTLLEKGRDVRPDLKIILTTGLASENEFRRWRRKREVIILKPWMEGEFIGAVEKLLESRTPAENSGGAR